MVKFANAWKTTFFTLLVFANWIADAEECSVRVGEYSGTVKAEWLTKTREMRLLEPFAFKDPNCKVWSVPSGAIVDGASIPQVFWSLIGGPFEGRYRDASVVHDYYCKMRTEPSEQVHEMFYNAMLANGVDSNKAAAMFYAVLWFGPKWHLIQKTALQSRPDAASQPLQVDELKYVTLSNDQLAAIASSSGQPPPLSKTSFTKFSDRTIGTYEPSNAWLKSEEKKIEISKILATSQSTKYANAKSEVIDIPSSDASLSIWLLSYHVRKQPTQSDLERIKAWIENEKPDLNRLKTTSPDQVPQKPS